MGHRFRSGLLVCALVAADARAQETAIRINPSGAELYRIAVVGGEGAAPIVGNDLDLTGYFRVLDPKGFPQALLSEPSETLNASNWMQVGAQGVAKVLTSGGAVDC